MIPPLPEGARLALLHWPWGTPTIGEIFEAMQQAGVSPPFDQHIANQLLAAGLIEHAPGPETAPRRYRLTQAGRRAVDAIQSGEAGQ